MPTIPPPEPVDRPATRLFDQSLDDFLALPEGTPAQFLDGEVLVSPAPLLRHQRIVMRLARDLDRFVQRHDLGEVLVAPVDVYLSDAFVVQPDVLFLSHERAGIAEREGLRGAPDLVVEVLSPSTAYYDLTVKRDAYEAHGVSEYWIVDPERETVTVLVRDGARYRTDADLRGEGRAASTLLDGFAMEVPSLFGAR